MINSPFSVQIVEGAKIRSKELSPVRKKSRSTALIVPTLPHVPVQAVR